MAFLLSLLLVSGTASFHSSGAAPAQKAAPQKPQPKSVQSEASLLAELQKADSAETAKPIVEKLETMFRASGSPSVDLLMTRAQVAAAASDKVAAKKLVDAVTTIAPRYAEGWHVRAALENAAGEDAAAMVSLQKTVQLNPRHFTAMVELADMLQEYGDKTQALKLYRRAIALNPQMEGADRQIRELTRDVEGQDI